MTRSDRPIIFTIVLCTLAIILAIVWPRVFPRYVDVPSGGALDRWTGEECSVWRRYFTERDAQGKVVATFQLCQFETDRPQLRRVVGQHRWRISPDS